MGTESKQLHINNQLLYTHKHTPF